MNKKRNYSSKKLTDIPQRVIIHKILVLHDFEINETEKNPFLLFGYFKNDRLRNIWFVFTSIRCFNTNRKKFPPRLGFLDLVVGGDVVNVLKNLIVDYSKLFNIFFDDVIVPKNLAKLSSRMYTLRSIGCRKLYRGKESSFPEHFYLNSKFPNLRKFYLHSRCDFDFKKNWTKPECTIFEHLNSLELVFQPHVWRRLNVEFDCGSFFRSKEKVFGKNLKVISLFGARIKEKLVISLPNLEYMKVVDCENLYIIPSEKKMKDITLFLTDSHDRVEIEKIAKASRNAKIIGVHGSCKAFIELFEKEDFPYLKRLALQPDNTFETIKKWKFSNHLTELRIQALGSSDVDFFQKNEWDQLEELVIQHCNVPLQTKGVKFPNLSILFIDDEFETILSDSFFSFEGKRLKEMYLSGPGVNNRGFTGEGWNKDIFKSLETLAFRNEFDESIFQRFEFPNLRKLAMFDNTSLKDRESWKEMKKLEIIDVKNSEGFQSHISSWKKVQEENEHDEEDDEI